MRDKNSQKTSLGRVVNVLLIWLIQHCRCFEPFGSQLYSDMVKSQTHDLHCKNTVSLIHQQTHRLEGFSSSSSPTGPGYSALRTDVTAETKNHFAPVKQFLDHSKNHQKPPKHPKGSQIRAACRRDGIITQQQRPAGWVCAQRSHTRKRQERINKDRISA